MRRLDSPINQRRMAELSAQLEAARALLHTAASAFDQGWAASPLPYIQAKVVCAEAAVRVTQDLMTMFGGTAFAGRLPFERYFRDALSPDIFVHLCSYGTSSCLSPRCVSTQSAGS